MAKRIVVVGGGLAGFAAAVTAASDGASVVMVSRAPGATALYAGAMEITPEPERLIQLPDHPFNRLGLDATRLVAELDESCRQLAAVLGREGLELRGGAGERGRYADLHGRPHEAQLVPAAVAGGELTKLRGRRVAVVGIPGVSEYDAESTAAVLKELAGVDARPVQCEIEDLPVEASITDLLGRPAPRPAGRHDAFAYPPGFTDLPASGFELLAAAPSPHGWHLQRALERALERANVEVLRARVDRLETEGGRVQAAHVAETRLEADAFVLATGRYIGGGLQRGARVREPLLDLTVFFDGAPVEDKVIDLRHLEYLAPEPGFRSGLLTDERLRPVGTSRQPLYENLRAAGAVLGGRDYADGAGFGVPLLTGRLAGRWSARS